MHTGFWYANEYVEDQEWNDRISKYILSRQFENCELD
jgi:hypothetical protein